MTAEAYALRRTLLNKYRLNWSQDYAKRPKNLRIRCVRMSNLQSLEERMNYELKSKINLNLGILSVCLTVNLDYEKNMISPSLRQSTISQRLSNKILKLNWISGWNQNILVTAVLERQKYRIVWPDSDTTERMNCASNSKNNTSQGRLSGLNAWS